MRRQQKNRRSSPTGHSKVITVAEMQMLRDRLDRSQRCGPAFQAATITEMEKYKGAYYQTPHGLRRVFTKEQEAILFAPATMSLLTQKLKVQDPMQRPEWAKQSAREGESDAADQPQADLVRNQ
jgi:hypothetical protein